MARQTVQLVQRHTVDAAAEAGRALASWVGERMKSTSLCALLADAGTHRSFFLFPLRPCLRFSRLYPFSLPHLRSKAKIIPHQDR